MENMKMNERDLTVTTVNEPENKKMDFTCPYCNARFEYEEGTEGVIFHAPDDPGFLPEGRKNQVWWLISYSLGMLMLGAVLYKFIAPLV